MNIGIDGYEANARNLVGIGTFAYEVIYHLYEIDKKNSYTIFLPNAPLDHFPKSRENWQYRIIPSIGLWTFTSLPFGIWTQREKIDIFFSPTHYLPRFVNIPKIVSIMDLSYLHYPELFQAKDLYQLKNWTAYSLNNSKIIITISKFTKSEIIKFYGIPENKIVIAYPGYDKDKFKFQISKSKVMEIKNKYKINTDYLLFVGTLQPRKNIVLLIEAFNKAMKQKSNETMKLVIVGKKGWLYEGIFDKVAELKLDNRVFFLDFVNTDDMQYLYSGAIALVLPSLYEGFGLPVIEAMACGTPTVISNTSSLPEIAGDATIYIEPKSSESITGGLIRILNMKNADRDILVKKGLKNVKRFDWLNCSQEVLNAL